MPFAGATRDTNPGAADHEVDVHVTLVDLRGAGRVIGLQRKAERDGDVAGGVLVQRRMPTSVSSGAAV
jgi:hypothetical protein